MISNLAFAEGSSKPDYLRLAGTKGDHTVHQAGMTRLEKWGRENPDQIDKILKDKGPERTKFLKAFNKWLKENNLQEIRDINNIAIKKTCKAGDTSSNCFLGFEIDDGTDRFCYPCAPRTNFKEYVIGITRVTEPVVEDLGEPAVRPKHPSRRGGRN